MGLNRSRRPTAGLGLALLLASIGAAGCASGGGAGGGGGGSGNMITRAQLDGAAGGNAYDVIQQYRSRWLRPARNQNTLGGRATVRDRGGGDDDDVLPGQELYARVYMDGAYFGEIDSLARVDASILESIEYLSASDATTRYGTGNSGGVIELRTRALAR